MTNTSDSKKAAEARINDLIAIVRAQPDGDAKMALLEECEALGRAVAAFHLEGIRFRAFNVGRLLQKGGLPLPPEAPEAFADMRRHLEAAGFHTRSHQAPV
ncbi:MAG TPA: hypothetical protein VM364_18895 [Vicinamibacterales bacterium]|nr:hypothetical protein [Vicinamibacterales bacterium]